MGNTTSSTSEREATVRAAPGTTTEAMPVYIYRRWCKGCGLCVEFCPRGVLEMGTDNHPVVAQPDRCTYCRLCEVLCPDFGIAVGHKDKEQKE